MNLSKASLIRYVSQDLPASAFTSFATKFTILNGPIEVKNMGLLVGTALTGVTGTGGFLPLNFSFLPTGQTTPTALCAVTNIAGAAAEQLYLVDGIAGTALVAASDVGILAAGQALHMPLVLSDGAVIMNIRTSISNPGLAISTTPFKQVANNAFTFNINGLLVTKTATAAGTALAAGTIPQNKFGLYLFSIVAGGTITCTGAAGNAAGTYTTEAAAIAAMPAVPASSAAMGYVTVTSTDAGGFVATTTALNDGAVTAAYYSAYGAPVAGAATVFMSYYPLSADARVMLAQ
jgi:hypothetical protein